MFPQNKGAMVDKLCLGFDEDSFLFRLDDIFGGFVFCLPIFLAIPYPLLAFSGSTYSCKTYQWEKVYTDFFIASNDVSTAFKYTDGSFEEVLSL